MAQALGATLTPSQAAQARVTGVADPQTATPVSLLFAESAAALNLAQAAPHAAVLAREAPSGTVLLHPEPRLAFARAARLLRPPEPTPSIHPSAILPEALARIPGLSVGAHAVVGESAVLGEDVHIGAGAVVGAGCTLGAGCRIYPRAVLYPGVTVGARVVVHAGAVLGADGFGYVRDPATGAYTQFPQQGRLVIEDDVEIGANTTVDRGALAETRIRRGAKIDNLVHIGHNVEVGEDVVIAAQTGISGSSSIGRGAVIAGQVGIADHVAIGAGAILGAQCGVPSRKRLEGAGVVFWGTPARPIKQYLKELATLARLTRGRRTL